VGEQRLRALVEPRALDARAELAGADQHVVQARVAIEGEVSRERAGSRALARGEREQEQVRVAAGDRRLRQRDLVGARLVRRAQRPGGRNDGGGTAARPRVTASRAGSSAAATAWRSGLRVNGSFSVWNAR